MLMVFRCCGAVGSLAFWGSGGFLGFKRVLGKWGEPLGHVPFSWCPVCTVWGTETCCAWHIGAPARGCVAAWVMGVPRRGSACPRRSPKAAAHMPLQAAKVPPSARCWSLPALTKVSG